MVVAELCSHVIDCLGDVSANFAHFIKWWQTLELGLIVEVDFLIFLLLLLVILPKC